MKRSGSSGAPGTGPDRVPQTLAYGLADSPVGQLAWNLDWFAAHGDKPDALDRDAVLTNVSIYWFTNTAGSAGRLYKPEDLKPEDCIALFRSGTNQMREWTFKKGKVEHTILPRAPLSFSDPESAVSAAISGGGFVRMLDFAVEAQIAAGLLRPVLEDWNEDGNWPVWVVYPQHRQPTAKVRAFVDFVAGLFPSTGNGDGRGVGAQL